MIEALIYAAKTILNIAIGLAVMFAFGGLLYLLNPDTPTYSDTSDMYDCATKC